MAICEALVNDKLGEMDNLQSYSLSSGATGITDLATIEKSITSDEGKAKWEEIKTQLEEITAKIGSDIKVVNAQAGEEFDPATCPNVTIK